MKERRRDGGEGRRRGQRCEPRGVHYDFFSTLSSRISETAGNLTWMNRQQRSGRPARESGRISHEAPEGPSEAGTMHEASGVPANALNSHLTDCLLR